MVAGILRAKGILRGAPSTPADYELLHTRALAALVLRGVPVTLHTDPTPVAARIDEGRWLIDCACGAGAATDPDWGVARCFECGAVYSRVTFPDAETVAAIEEALVRRSRLADRFWFPHERLEDLRAENVSQGWLVAARDEGPSIEKQAEIARINDLQAATFQRSPAPDVARALARLMSELSEQYWSAGWLVGLEDRLWAMVSGGSRDTGDGDLVTDEEVSELRRLSQACGGWVRYDDDLGEVFVPIEEWRKKEPR